MQSDDDPQFNDSASDQGVPSREELALEYLDQLPYEPYPFQEQAILSWFESKQGVLVCAPTGMGKTLKTMGQVVDSVAASFSGR